MIRSLAVVSSLALVLAAAPATAQLPLRLGVMAGASMPTGDFKSDDGLGAQMGYNVGVLVTVKPPLFPVGVRGDVIYNEFSFDEDDLDGADLDFRILNVNANAVLEMPSIALTPYVLGGLGWYRGNFGGGDSDELDLDAESAIGFNVGGGIRFGLAGFGAAVEAHYRSVNLKFADAPGGEQQIRYIPVSFVLSF